MPSSGGRPSRKSIRLPDYDYTTPGAYFLTIVTNHRQSLFGDVVDGQLRLNPAGRAIEKTWTQLLDRYPIVSLDAYVVMPNHLHGIIVLGSEGDLVGAPLVGARADTETTTRAERPALTDIVGAFKSLSTLAYIDGVKHLSWQPFENKLWQRGYHEHIIRDEKSLERIQDYIIANPLMWESDPENPHSRSIKPVDTRRRLTRREPWMT